MTKKCWCVRHTEGWCACKRNRKPADRAWNVETKCKHFVTLPLGSALRTPTCPDCKLLGRK